MKILIIGGSGNISWHFTNECLLHGDEVYILNRKETIKTRRSTKKLAVKDIIADINDYETVKNKLCGCSFDAVVNFICYDKRQAKDNIKLFKSITNQFVFISSAANYDRTKIRRPLEETDLLHNPRWEYSNNKIECEDVFRLAYENDNFPITIVRPGHTYDTLLPDAVGNGCFTNAKRLLEGKPVLIHGDGTTLWTITHSSDFAKALYGLVGNSNAIGESFHITSDEIITWNEIMMTISRAIGNNNPKFVHVTTDEIMRYDYNLGIGIECHKKYCDIYNNNKIKKICNGWSAKVTAEEGIFSTVKWLLEDADRQRINSGLNVIIDKICYEKGDIK